ncbi:SDR family NAD(P)-dependent oxidoreductase [Pantoea sp. LMR881]|uniref:SDR family NAD(P)-dependent oxidoreductase n=1 Tax=Pantoea sp. LMR881 TaxID=3014336 RepID=UPI0022AFC266|nr:SDR family NAD(P)-dependent oxidoreductase [Pantoea sp. LMR881]MCZ4061632.1 SDR family NAD(P)-dependent oxidoreductase [Pantoea sp. LMR881]
MGLACAQALAAEGVQIILNGRDESKLQSVAQRLRLDHPETDISFIAADLTTSAGREKILSSLQQVDILVTNNAGPSLGAV